MIQVFLLVRPYAYRLRQPPTTLCQVYQKCSIVDSQAYLIHKAANPFRWELTFAECKVHHRLATKQATDSYRYLNLAANSR